MSPAVTLLSFIIFTPVIGAVILAFLPGNKPELLRLVTLASTGAVLVMCIGGFFISDTTTFHTGVAELQNTVNLPWIPSFDIEYFLGLDGINFPLVILTALISFLSMGASWSITKQVKGYCILFLLLETGMLGVFMALDFFLFYVFWEVMLLPMYFLIGIWGGPRKEYAAIKFFLYTLVGSVLMLIAILMLYFASDVRGLADAAFDEKHPTQVNWRALNLGKSTYERVGLGITNPNADTADTIRERGNARIAFLRKDANSANPLKVEFAKAGDVGASFDEATNTLNITFGENTTAKQVVDAVNGSTSNTIVARLPSGEDGSSLVSAGDSIEIPAYQKGQKVHTFNIMALAAIGQHTTQFDTRFAEGTWFEGPWFEGTWFEGRWFDQTLQWWAFLLLFIGFAIKVPAVPVHTWLPDAHVEAPTPISMILAGVLLKMGGYGILRICYPICPHGGYDLAYFVCLVGVISMVYGAFAALAQKDFKRMVAYSSVSHMGYVTLGLGVWSAAAGTNYDWQYWDMGVKGAMFQMIGHGISSPGMFFMVGIIYDRVHHRNLEEFGGLYGKMPFYTAMAIGIFFAGLGLPGLCGFIGEVFVVLSVWKYSMWLAIISAGVVVLTAAYILWAIQRVYLGAEYKGPHGDHLHEANLREKAIGVTLLLLCIILGVFPHQTVLKYMDATIKNQVQQLTAWTQNVKEREETSMPPAMVSQDTANKVSLLDQ